METRRLEAAFKMFKTSGGFATYYMLRVIILLVVVVV